MNPLIDAFRNTCQTAARFLRIPNGRLLNEFYFNDFLTNVFDVEDDAATIAVKALAFFCDEDTTPQQTVFQWTVYAVCLFLEHHLANRQGTPIQPMQDLVHLLQQTRAEDPIRNWITANF